MRNTDLEKAMHDTAEAAMRVRDAAIAQTETAFGGCKSCYGKGYATVIENASTSRETWSLSRMRYCTCERGQALEAEVKLEVEREIAQRASAQ
jgi:hypothetical protein